MSRQSDPMEKPRRLNPGDILGRYRIVELLGAGGMGEVYRAYDSELDRQVAIKVLPPSLADDPERLERFTREAKALARSTNSHVLQIFDFARDRGISFAVTELLDGENLRTHITGRALPWREAVTIAVAVVDGLAAAHRRGVIHRDLKPENIFRIADGNIKVLDFGLARMESVFGTGDVTGSLSLNETEEGTIVGTVGYIAPEVLRGQRADARSDLFAVGCVLYEMITGGRAFPGASPAETMAAILDREPAPPSSVNGSMPAQLDRIVMSCLAKDPEERIQTADELAEALRAVADAATGQPRLSRSAIVWLAACATLGAMSIGAWLLHDTPQPLPEDEGKPRVVVAVFTNLSDDPDLNLLGEIAADSIAQGLSLTGAADAVPGMAAISACKSIQARCAEDPELDPLAALARRTGATVVVSGSIHLVDDAVEIRAQITDVVTNHLVAAVAPERGPTDRKIDVLERIRRRIMGAVAMEYRTRFEASHLSRCPDFESMRELSNGIHAFGEDYDRAIRHFHTALEIDPENFGAATWLVGALNNLGRHGEASEVMARLEASKSHWTDFERSVFARVRYAMEGNTQGALREARITAQLVPSDAISVYLYALAAMAANHPAEALQAMEDFDDSVDMNTSVDFFWDRLRLGALHLTGRFDEELTRANGIAGEHPELPFVHVARVRALAGLERNDAVDVVIDQMLRVGSPQRQAYHLGTVGGAMATMASELLVHGYPEDARHVAQRSVAWFAEHRGPLATPGAQVDLLLDETRACALLGRWDDCLRLLDEAESQLGEGGLVPVLRIAIRGERGVVAAWKGDRTTARQILAWLAARHDPYIYGENLHQCARIESLIGESRRAVDHLREAFARGLEMNLHIHHDPALEALRDNVAFRALLQPEG